MRMKYIEFYNFIFKGRVENVSCHNGNYSIFVNCMQGLFKCVLLVFFIKLFFVILDANFSSIESNGVAVTQQHEVLKIIFICLLGPLIEEFAFRMPLSLNRNQILFSIPCIVFLVFIFFKKIFSIETSLIFCFLFALLIYITMKIGFAKDHSFILIHILTFLFAISHWNNSKDLDGLHFFFRFTIYIIPMLITGYFLAYIRLKYSLFWAIITHCTHNLVFTLPIIFKIFWK
jgi:hypothetical protein